MRPLYVGLIVITPALTGLSGNAVAVNYYVSPTGSDFAPGTSAQTPWATLSKINVSSFNPGDRILLERGAEWHESLKPPSSGTAAEPIVFDAYGTGAKPKLWGSDPIPASSFQPYSGNTYVVNNYGGTVNSVLHDHQFLSAAFMKSGLDPDSAGNIDFVKHNSNTWYHAPDGKLYVNANGVDPRAGGRSFTAAVRDDVVAVMNKHNVTVRNIVVEESAKDDAGYAFRVQGGSNIVFEDSEAYRAGKHHFGTINSTGFVGKNLYSAYTMPDQAGASAYVTYSDATRTDDTSVWDTITSEKTGGYDSFYSHGDGNGVGRVLVKNITARGGGIDAHLRAGAISFQGAVLEDGATLNVSTDNTIADGIQVCGKNSYISIAANNSVVQNVVATRYNNNTRLYAVIDDHGRNNVIRFSTFDIQNGAAISSVGANTNTLFYGNIIRSDAISMMRWLNTDSGVRGHDNVYWGSGMHWSLNTSTWFWSQFTHEQWAAMGLESNSHVIDPMFRDPANGDYTLLPNSPAIGLLMAANLQFKAPTFDALGNPRTQGAVYTPGAFQPSIIPEPAMLLPYSTLAFLLRRRRR